MHEPIVSLGRPGKSKSRSEVVLVWFQSWYHPSPDRNRRPEQRRRTTLAGERQIVQIVNWLRRVFVTHAKIQSQIWSELPIVLNEVILIILSVRDDRWTNGQVNCRWRIVDEPGCTIEGKIAVEPRQEWDLVIQVLVLAAHQQGMLAANQGKSVSSLIDLDD